MGSGVAVSQISNAAIMGSDAMWDVGIGDWGLGIGNGFIETGDER